MTNRDHLDIQRYQNLIHNNIHSNKSSNDFTTFKILTKYFTHIITNIILRSLYIINFLVIMFLAIFGFQIQFLQQMGKELSEKEIERLKKQKQKERQKKAIKKQNRKENDQKRKLIKQRISELHKKEQQQETVSTQVSYVDQNILTGRYYDELKQVFEKAQQKAGRYYLEEQEIDKKKSQNKKQEVQVVDENKLSRKKKKTMRWLRVAQLKQIVKRPDLVEAWDITAMDPLFLIYLKSMKNTVPVPRHWNQKSKFLQSKRGILKPMFKLPQFIEATGISKLRDPVSERDGQKMVRQKLRERMNPRLGKIDIDYGVLHDAFFKYQTKSKMTGFGDTFYQGKQQQGKARQFKPGLLSEQLRVALGITDYQAPPWIINMQRYGSPPNYPTLRILGTNTPFSQISSYSLISKASLEEASKKIGHAGLYATFRSYYDQDKQDYIDKGYWGQLDDQMMEEQIQEQEEYNLQQFEQFDQYE